MTFLSILTGRIKDFFFYLFFSANGDFKNRKLLRSILADVKKASYPLYRADKTILPGLPVLFYEIYQSILPIYAILKETIESSDIRVSSMFLDKLVESVFSDSQREERYNMELSERCDKILELDGEQFEAQLKEQSKAFDAFMTSLSEPKFAKFDTTINKLYVFFDFCQFRFNDFFMRFDPMFKTANRDGSKGQYNFQNIRGELVFQDLLDLDFLIRGIVIDDDFIEVLNFLNLAQDKAKQKNKTVLKKRLQTFSNLIENKLRKTTLRNLAKLIRQDPYFEDNPRPRPEFHALADYKMRLSDIFNAGTMRISHMKREQQMTSFVEQVFKDIPAIPLNYYTEELDAQLQSATHISLEWATPLRLIKTYTVQFFQAKCEPFLCNLIVEGYFDDNILKSNLSAEYHFCKTVPEKIDEFESLMEEKNENSLSAIKGYLMRLESGGDFEQPLTKIVKFLNVKAKELLQSIGMQYANLYKSCMTISKDAHKAVPEIIGNLRTIIVSGRNKELFTVFDEHLEDFGNFIEILRRYIAFVERTD